MRNAKGARANMNTFCRSAAFKLGYADYIAGRALREQWDLDKIVHKQGLAAWRYERGRMFGAWCKARAKAQNKTLPAKINGMDLKTIVRYFDAALKDNSII